MQNNGEIFKNTVRNNFPIHPPKNKILCQWISETNIVYGILMNKYFRNRKVVGTQI